MEFIWRPFFKHLGKSTQIFTSIMYDHYYWPAGFNYDERDSDDSPVITDKTLSTFNGDEKVKDMLKYVNDMRQHYRTNHLLVPMGGDFSYANAHLNFLSMDRLITYFNANVKNITLMYSTPSDYLKAVKAANVTWPTNYDDMMPYADNPNDFWSGYFTSRANQKIYIRDGQSSLHSSNKLYSLKVLDKLATDAQIEEVLFKKYRMLDAMGIYQHHDAATGTAK